MEPMVIAAATESEREWCAQLMASCDPWITLGRGIEQCRPICNHEQYRLLVAHCAGQPCGFVLMHPRGMAGSPYVAAIAVAPEYRGQGVGSRLLESAAREFPGARHLFLCVSSFNARARALYERLGFQAAGELRDYIVPGASEIIMHKETEPRA
jgi:ribosomal protein S18 acetylase RimI-like enzyme